MKANGKSNSPQTTDRKIIPLKAVKQRESIVA